ncbi:MAG: hypothetical protein AAFZ15_05615 [Bacteroidota bacterium]
MKRLFTFLAFVISFSTQMDAQMSAASFGLSVGGDIEMPHGLDEDYLLRTAVDNDFDASMIPFGDGELVRMDCDNGTARFTAAFSPAGKANREIQFSLLTIDGRIDMVRYELPEEGHFAEVSAENEEIAIEGVYVFRDKMGKRFNFHVGVGTNIGYSHSGKVRIRSFYETESDIDVPTTTEEIDLEYDQNNSINQRLFVQGGAGVRFLKKFELSLMFRKGLGYRATFDGPFNMTTLKSSVSLGVYYRI